MKTAANAYYLYLSYIIVSQLISFLPVIGLVPLGKS